MKTEDWQKAIHKAYGKPKENKTMNHTPTPWQKWDKNKELFTDGKKLIGEVYDKDCFRSPDDDFDIPTPEEAKSNAAFIVQAVNAHEEAMELLERVTIELHRKLVTGGMETNVAESLGLDELLIDIEGLLAKAGVRV